MSDDMIFPVVLSDKDTKLIARLLRTERDQFTAAAIDCDLTDDTESAKVCRRSAEHCTALLDKIQSVTPVANITIDDLIFYSVRYYKQRNRRQHVDAVAQWQFLTGSERATTYEINKRMIELVSNGDLIEERKNQYAGWRYRLGERNPRAEEDAERVKQIVQAWTEYRVWNWKQSRSG